MVAITVDDCFFIGTMDDDWREEQVNILRNAFKEVTVEYGDIQQIIGMTVQMDRINKLAKISQRNYVDNIINKYNITKSSVTPSTGELFDDDDTSPLLADQKAFMSLNSTLMYGVKRTYSECLPAVVKLSTKYNKATEADWNKAIRVAEYMYGTKEEHCLMLCP
jgi:hypothetical protein